jgi:hypothetical protein
VRHLLLALSVAVVAACSGGGSSAPKVETTTPLRIADVPAAVAALEQRLGGPQRYTEINATPDGVNLFVANAAGGESPWFYRSGHGLEPPPADGVAAATAFGLAGVDLTLGTELVLQVQQQFPEAVVESVALVDLPGRGLVWAVRSRSVKGGELDLLFSPDGQLLSAAPSG